MNLRDFNADGHWYSSYPSLNHWEDMSHAVYAKVLKEFKGPLHLYLHIPFCAKLCFYCICNLTVTNDRQKIQHFLDILCKEIDLLKPYSPDIRDLHFGGGTPSHLDQKQFTQLCEKLNELTDLKSIDVAMEIDPRTVKQDDLRHYASHGVNRISFGVQDFNLKVQEAINRVQPSEMIEVLLTPEIRKLFTGVNFDLLYGLPFQTLETVKETLDKVLQFRPDRLTVLKYCHAPEVRRHMKLIDETALPPKDQLRPMFELIVDTLTEAGYLWIGLDHFCLPTDPLSKKVGRTFNGFTSGTTEMIGLGPTTTGVFGTLYCQSQYHLHDYYESVNKGEFPIFRGYKMSYEDILRRKVIFDLLCNQTIDFKLYGTFFDKEASILQDYPDLCSIRNGVLTVTHEGRLLLRNLCKVFDNKDIEPQHHKIAQYNMVKHARPLSQPA